MHLIIIIVIILLHTRLLSQRRKERRDEKHRTDVFPPPRFVHFIFFFGVSRMENGKAINATIKGEVVIYSSSKIYISKYMGYPLQIDRYLLLLTVRPDESYMTPKKHGEGAQIGPHWQLCRSIAPLFTHLTKVLSQARKLKPLCSVAGKGAFKQAQVALSDAIIWPHPPYHPALSLSFYQRCKNGIHLCAQVFFIFREGGGETWWWHGGLGNKIRSCNAFKGAF